MPRKAVRTGKTAGPANVANPLPDLRSFSPGSAATLFTIFPISMPTRTTSPGRFIHLAAESILDAVHYTRDDDDVLPRTQLENPLAMES